MKINKLIVLTLAGVLSAAAYGAASKSTSPVTNRAEVVFLEPGKYTDVRGSLSDTGDRNGYLDQLRDYVVKVTPEYLPDGHRLQITFTDIDLAGDFPPVQRASSDGVRVMKAIYPPRMVFAFRVTDAAGNVVKQGNAELMDTNYLTTGSLTDRGDPLRYDKALLGDWFRNEFVRK